MGPALPAPSVVASLVYNDFITVSLARGANTNDVDIFCVPLQFIYPLNNVKLETTLTANNVNRTPNPTRNFFVFDTQAAAKGKWFYTRCAFSIDLGTMFINQKAEVVLPIPQQFNGSNNFSTYIKKFYAQADTVNFDIRGFGGAGGLTVENYLRNINVYKEYIPSNINYPNYL